MRSSLSRVQGRSPTNHDDIQRLRKAAWHSQNVLTVNMQDPDVRLDPFERQFLTNIGNRLFGRRE
jgi:hypothetical protein